MHIAKHFTNYALASLFLVSVLFSSCGGDDESEDPNVQDDGSFALAIGTTEDDETKSCRDASGNTILVGAFKGTLKIGDIQLVSAGGVDIFLAKYKSNGDLVWAKRAGGTGYDNALGIHADKDGNIFITGQLTIATFDNITLTSTGYGNDMYVVKYNSSGSVTWARQYGGNTGALAGLGITTDAGGLIYVTGALWGKANFGETTLTTSGSSDAFLTKLNASGDVIWAKKGGGIDTDEGSAVKIDAAGGIYVCGNITGTADFSGVSLTSSGFSDVFIARYSSYGTILWAKKAGGVNDDYAQDIALTTGGAVVTGTFHNTANFSGTELVAAGDADDSFTAKYTSSGELSWAKKLSGASAYDASLAVFVDASDQTYVTGVFGSATASDGVHTITNSGTTDIFVTKYSAAGEPLWSRSAGQTSPERGTGISVDTEGFVYVTGMFSGTSKLGSKELVSTGKNDVFLWKFKP